MTEVTLKRITVANWQECIELRVTDDQVGLVPGNLYSIAEAQFYPSAVPLAIQSVEGAMVGFIMYGIDVASGKWKVFRLMIDEAHQGKDYCREAMEQVVQELADRPDCDEILICYRPSNHAARELYADLGFLEQETRDGKVLARLELTKSRAERLAR